MSFDLSNRRYTGSKSKLSDWIFEIIDKNCNGRSFCDIFAGTGVIAQHAMDRMEKVIINDFLFSNEIIYRAFFEKEVFDEEKILYYKNQFSNLNGKEIENNYVSNNYGDKFFSLDDSKIIGEIREQIYKASNLNNKERNILLASLLYSLDKCANTVGHYDAYIKGHNIKNKFKFDIINPYNTSADVQIFREDANTLSKKIESDIVYIDPPYNSRQYSRFYHVLENITTWKKPKLYGEALKPQPENMSEYCRNKAVEAFSELITNLKCKYIIVSYNNTYNSKSSSSKNKITIENIKDILSKRGKLKCYEKPYKFFNAGKTNFADHKEFLFVVEVN